MNRQDAINVLRRVVGAILETVRESGDHGAAETAVVMSLESQGFSPSYAREIVNALVAAGQLTRRNHTLFPA